MISRPRDAGLLPLWPTEYFLRNFFFLRNLFKNCSKVCALFSSLFEYSGIYRVFSLLALPMNWNEKRANIGQSEMDQHSATENASFLSVVTEVTS